MKKTPFAHLVKSGLIEFSSSKKRPRSNQLAEIHRKSMINLAQDGFTIQQIAHELDIGASTVLHALNRFGERIYLTHEQIKKFKLRPPSAPAQKPKKPQNPKKT
jgi:transposase